MDPKYKLINPYSLLGVKHTCSVSELKKQYYNLSLLTHPDKGGNKEDFNVVHLAYNYIKTQIENIKDVTYEELEDEFDEFCKKQESIKPPCFYEVFKETNDWLNKFNQEFENQKNEDNELELKNPFEEGYGKLLDKSEVNLKYNENEIKKPNTKICQQIIKYEEPAFLPDSINYYPLNQEEIKDFSSLDGNLNGYDYKLTHSNKDTLEDEMKKLEIEYKFSDYPKEKLEYKI